jgi:hypothetical protein
VFSRAHEWLSLGGDKASGANELLSTRAARSVRFSGLDPALLVAAYPHPPPQDDPDMDVDLKPFKVRAPSRPCPLPSPSPPRPLCRSALLARRVCT